jgi:glucose/arabinose dehydrogenase
MRRRDVVARGVLLCTALALLLHPSAQTTLPAGFQDAIVLVGLEQPTAVRFSPDGRVFVAEKSGLIRVFSSLTDPQSRVFADLRTEVHNFWDRGLLGLALDPHFPATPYVYVLYTRDAAIGGTPPRWGVAGQTSDGCPAPPGATDDGCVVSGRLARLTASGDVAIGRPLVLVDGWFQQYPSHSIGSVAFGADGALYASGGDGASWQFVDFGQKGIPTNPGGDPPVAVGGIQTAPAAQGGALRSQDLRTSGDPIGLDGSMIRVDPRTGAAMRDNPLAANADLNARRIVAYGLRNPFRFAIRPGTNEVWVGDVGQSLWEEIDRIVDPRAGVSNFGWPCYEGGARQPGWDAANVTICKSLYAQAGAVVAPFFQYRQGAAIRAGEPCASAGGAISGLAFYQGGAYPAQYNGALFFSDYTRRCIWTMMSGAGGVPDNTKIATFLSSAAAPVELQIGPGGDLFYVDLDGGTVHRVQYLPGNQPPHVVATATPDAGRAPLTVLFDASASFDPEHAGPLTFSWDLDANGIFGEATSSRPSRTYTANGTYAVGLRATDAAGMIGTATVNVVVGNTRPSAFIDAPASTLRWAVGDTMAFAGHAKDPESGALAAPSFLWSLILHHCSSAASCHQHPIQDFRGVSSGSFVAPDHDSPSYLELRLMVTDPGGLTGVTSARLDSQTVALTLDSTPRGLQLAAAGVTVTTPGSVTALVGSAITVSAPTPQVLAGVGYAFTSWADGGAPTRIVKTTAAARTFTAAFSRTAVNVPPDIVIYAKRGAIKAGSWHLVADTAAAGGQRLEQPDAGVKTATPLASPLHAVEWTFDAEAGRAYRLWMRGRALNDSFNNDSVYAQFDGSVDAAGTAVFRIGTTQATPVILEDCGGCGLAGWGWADNAYGAGALGPLIYFAAAGPQRLRIQAREDGVSLDQIVLSATAYLAVSPGATKNDSTILPPTVPP